MHIRSGIVYLLPIAVIIVLISIAVVFITTSPVQAETGLGTDIFKVILTIFGVDESKGDVIAIVTAKDQDAKVKLFDALGPEVVPLNVSEGGGHLIEYVATFPNLTMNSGEGYKACIATVKNLELMCKTGDNSPASRPEFVDLSLNTTRGDVQQATAAEGEETITVAEEGDSNDEDQEEVVDQMDETESEAEEGDDLSPGAPPIG
ncbi:MAG: hypothetical protein WBW34_10375 [Nitrososphaeraceae archaeon]